MTSPSQETQGVGALSFEQRHEIARAATKVSDRLDAKAKAEMRKSGMPLSAIGLAGAAVGWRLFALAITEPPE